MKFVTLKSFDKKKILISTLIVTSLILVVTIFVSHAEFTSTDHVTIVDGVINYTPYDFKIMAMYIENSTSYEETDIMPSSGYVINETMSYCYKTNPNEKIIDKVYTNSDGEHIIKDLEKNTKCILYFDSLSKKAYNTLVKLNPELKSNGDTAHFTDTSTNLNENGIYEAEDDDGISYYFRGSVENNYVKFGKDKSNADIWWRIIRINGDGSIRMMYAGTSTNGIAPAKTDPSTNITVDGNTTFTYAINGEYANNKYVGYQYKDGELHGKYIKPGNGEKSNVAIQLETWFQENLLDEFQLNNSKIDKNAGFCADRTVISGTGIENTVTIYSANERTYRTFKPSLKCQNEDLFTSIESPKGTRSLTYPIGLSTVDEQIFAGISSKDNETNYYLYNGFWYWTMTPAKFMDNHACVYNLRAGEIWEEWIDSTDNLRPVINLVSGSLTKGTGTVSDPFIIE